jgi:hypothetical protein
MDGADWLDEDVEPVLKGFATRPAHAAEILQVFGASMEHSVGLVDGIPVGMVSLKRFDNRLWAMLTMLKAPDETWYRMQIVQALRKEMKRLAEPVWVVQDGEQAAKLLKLVGLNPTDETMGHRRVWMWAPPVKEGPKP